jgi:hypothetical protein
LGAFSTNATHAMLVYDGSNCLNRIVHGPKSDGAPTGIRDFMMLDQERIDDECVRINLYNLYHASVGPRDVSR